MATNLDGETDRDRAIEERLNKSLEREGGYRTQPAEPVLMRRGGTLRLNFELQQRLEADNAALKAQNAKLRKALKAAGVDVKAVLK